MVRLIDAEACGLSVVVLFSEPSRELWLWWETSMPGKRACHAFVFCQHAHPPPPPLPLKRWHCYVWEAKWTCSAILYTWAM